MLAKPQQTDLNSLDLGRENIIFRTLMDAIKGSQHESTLLNNAQSLPPNFFDTQTITYVQALDTYYIIAGPSTNIDPTTGLCKTPALLGISNSSGGQFQCLTQNSNFTINNVRVLRQGSTV